MAMTEALAATGAQTIPIFALGGVLEARAAIQSKREHEAPRMSVLSVVLRIAWITVLLITGAIDLSAELACLHFLSHDTVNPDADTLVIAAMMVSLTVLAIFPLISLTTRAHWLLGWSNIDNVVDEAAASAFTEGAQMVRSQRRRREMKERRD